MNPDQRESLERKNPHKYGGLGLVSIYVHECQTLLFCVNLYCSKPLPWSLLRSLDAKSAPWYCKRPNQGPVVCSVFLGLLDVLPVQLYTC